tara:strand:- start:1691 stop:2467 length:777 start_codon:yes stop_codon:yes gene_type:complete
MDYLAKKNIHDRDNYITFDEGPHIYTVHGDSSFTSVTTFIHSNFSHFDSESIVNKIVASNRWNTDEKYKYYKKTKEEILKMWEDKRDHAAKAGTKLHYDIECYYNNCPNENDSVEYQYFKNFVKDFPDLIPYRTEWMVYYEEYKLSGSIDMIFENKDGTLQIYDWKRSEEFKYEDSFNNSTSSTDCLKHLPDTNFWHYSLQLNMYKTIIEHKYGKKVTGLYLVRIHPDDAYKNYERVQVPFLEKEINDLLEHRKNVIS